MEKGWREKRVRECTAIQVRKTGGQDPAGRDGSGEEWLGSRLHFERQLAGFDD